MCNLYRLEKGPDAIRKLFDEVQIPLGFPEGIPNFEPRDVHITDRAPIVRASDAGAAQLVERRWSWPGPTGKPVYNLRSDNREFPTGRCLVLADGFYEYTAPADPKQKRKDRWLIHTGRWRNVRHRGLRARYAGHRRGLLAADDHSVRRCRAIPQSADRPASRPADWKRWLESSDPGRRPAPAAPRRNPQGRSGLIDRRRQRRADRPGEAERVGQLPVAVAPELVGRAASFPWRRPRSRDSRRRRRP